MQTSLENYAQWLDSIKKKKWWQGSLISGHELSSIDNSQDGQIHWWVIASQTCNLYNPDFSKVPVFEVIAAKEIQNRSPDKIRGRDPRILHVIAQSENETISLEIDIQKRAWLSRQQLVELTAPNFHIRDNDKKQDPHRKEQWLDTFIGWLSRSYNRVTLPDEFNHALKQSKIAEVLDSKLVKKPDELYGIYLLIEQDSDDGWPESLGTIPPPYLVGITVAIFSDIDPDPIKAKLVDLLFKASIQHPKNQSETTRSKLAGEFDIRLIEEGVEVRSINDISLFEISTMVRYSFVDYLSDSKFAVYE